LGEKNQILIKLCNECSHVFADLGSFDFNRKDLNVFRDDFTHGLMNYDEQYYDHLVKGELLGHPTQITTSKVLAMIHKHGFINEPWFDIGSGSGYLLEQALKFGFNACGIEPGGWGQIASKRKKVKIVQGFLEKNLTDSKYSIVSATDVVEHVPDPSDFLELMATYLENDGVIVISVPCYESFEAQILGLNWSMIEPPTHRHFFTKKSLAIALANSGLKPLKMQQFNIRRFFGLSRYEVVRRFIDLIIPGDQLICMAMLNGKK
jgi:2-polyprenyl-3-methyl-5-hydroxy-6-metoxy-1,4-benzoquinol methylase